MVFQKFDSPIWFPKSKDMNKEMNFVLNLVNFIIHWSTSSQLQSQDKQSPSPYSYTWFSLILNYYSLGIEISENQLKEAKQLVEESDIKYDEVARKLAMVEGDLRRATERDEAGMSKIVDLEEELRVIGESLKALEVAEEKAQQREEEYKKQVKY